MFMCTFGESEAVAPSLVLVRRLSGSTYRKQVSREMWSDFILNSQPEDISFKASQA